MKKILKNFSTILLSYIAIGVLSYTTTNQTTVFATGNANVATRTHESIGVADGVKDAAYNKTPAIPISVVAHENENESPATGEMYMLWDTSYLYVFVEITDDSKIAYVPGTWIELNDSFEMMIDLYHQADYWLDGYGGEYRNDWYGSGGKMCEGMYKIAAGVNQATVDSTIQGTHWMWDDQKNNGSYYSSVTEAGYTVEYKISVGQDAGTYLKANREIGIGAKIYDRHKEDKHASVTVLESKNDGQLNGPRNLSNVVLVEEGETPKAREEVVLQGRDGYIAYKTSSTIVADGVKDAAWNEAQAIDLVYVRQFANENVGRVTAYMLWDADYFYLFVEVADKTLNACPSSEAGNYNNYDSVGLCLDLLRNTNATNFDTGDYKTSIGFGGDYRGDKMCEGFWALTRGATGATIGTHWMWDDGNTRARSSFASISNEDGYTVEMKLYAGNNKDEFMQAGRKIGVGINVSDQFVNGGTSGGTVSHAVLDNKNFPNNDRAWGKVWAQGPSALSEVTLEIPKANKEVAEIFSSYYNNGIYIKDSNINIVHNAQEEISQYFHAGSTVLNRTTYYSGDALWMSRGNGEYSYYGTAYDGETPIGVTNATATTYLVTPESPKIVLSGEGKESMENYYVTLKDFVEYDYNNPTWTENSDGIYESTNPDVINKFRLFTAPCFLEVAEATNYITFRKVTIQIINNKLVMRLHVDATNIGLLTNEAKENLVFSEATIYN